MITLYDFETTLPQKWVSPSSLKVRLALNYKGIPYKTVFFKLAEIEDRAKELGLPRDDTIPPRPDGSLKYTVPIIHDPSTNECVVDSTRIVSYLDKTYPDTPRLITPGTEVLLGVLEATVRSTLSHPIVLTRVALSVEGASAAEFRKRVEGALKATLEEFASNTQAQADLWKKVKDGLDTFDGYFKKADLVSDQKEGVLDGPFIGGKDLAYADLILGSVLLWFRRVLGEDNEDWKALASWNEGRWGGVVKSLEKYTAFY